MSGIYPLKCPVCSQSYQTYEEISRHYQFAHPEEMTYNGRKSQC
jgi:hypothetical protein